ncbi:MAG: hypothetical protein HZB20_11745 [Chloroflexi bacterium]|nr:hypothetical protein [Chloroflexota bacterium]
MGFPGVKAAPAVAVLSLWAMVLLIITTFAASCKAIPPPANPATLFTIELLNIQISYQVELLVGETSTSWPLTLRSITPPPSPDPALFPWITFPVIVTDPEPGVCTIALPTG